MPRRRATQLITAEEIACYAYCPEQWRLQHGCGLAPCNQDALNAGVRHHARKAVAERLGSFLDDAGANPDHWRLAGADGVVGDIPMIGSTGILAAAALVFVSGLALLLTGRAIRRRRGLGRGRTVSLDKLTLTSLRLGLTGRPDRLIKANGTIIVEEWKSSRQVPPWHLAQMGVYFLLVEEELRIRPPHGFLVCGDGTRHRIDNSEELRRWVLELASQIRAARSSIREPIPADPKPGQCRPCGQRGNCSQARL